MVRHSSRLAFAAGALATLALAGTARAEQCSFFDAVSNESADGVCAATYDGDSETIAIGERRFVFVQSARQGQWAVGTLDGEPAMRYEINRETYSYATRDLRRFLDRSAE